MRVLSAAEMQACDRLTTERFGVPSLDLMRAASAAVAAFARHEFPRARRVTVLCGRGNNGGDGMMAARLLASAGLEVTTLLLGSPNGLTGDAAAAWRELSSLEGGPAHGLIHIIETAEDLARHKAALDADLILDAVVGTGFKPPLKGLAAAALKWLEGSTAPVLAVDLPSGWPADETAATVATPVFPADAVITFTAPKPAHLFGQLTRHWSQPIVVAPIGSPEEAIVSGLNLTWAGSALSLAQEPRPAAANKGNFGHVLVVGGSVGKSGAPAMTALAALRAGAGLVTAAVPAPVLPLVAAIAPELMTCPLAATPSGCISAENLAPETLALLTAGKTVLAIGPGLGQSPETIKFTTGLLSATKIPAVIDADALNILAAKPVLLAKLAKGRQLVLTPHPGEMARLAGITVTEVQANRLEVARSFAQRTGVSLVLKGARTLIAHPDGCVAVNTTGNPGMAKGGSGDLLTGLIAGLLAQHPSESARAVEAAVYLHGLAADMAVRRDDEHTLLATDSLAQLAQAFRFHSRGPSGYLWLQGLPAELLQATAFHEESQ
ncbi:MAG: NAD(P)H-hydrate dehydratase [Terracidiphilus sp.]|jgi:NAD(P)H-hydrate epimerase